MDVTKRYIAQIRREMANIEYELAFIEQQDYSPEDNAEIQKELIEARRYFNRAFRSLLDQLIKRELAE